MSFDFSEIIELADDLDRAPARAVLGVRKVMQGAAQTVKTKMKGEAAGVEHAPGFPAAITFETKFGASGVEAEIGPRRGGAGSLALLYYGNSRTGPRLPDPMLIVAREAPNLADELAKLGVESLDG